MRKSSELGIYNLPIRYTKKLILAILFIYAGAYENFIISVIIMCGLLTIITSVVYRPFRNKVDLYLSCIFEGLFCLGCLGLCVLMVSYLQLTPAQKLKLSAAVVAVFIILSFLLLLYNLGMIVLQGIKHFSGKDYLAKLYYP